MAVKIALSTCWHSSRHTCGEVMLREAAELGYRWVELSHGVRISLVPGILKALEAGALEGGVASVHNFCPLPNGLTRPAPNLYEPSATEPRERASWLKYTRKSIDFAAETGAGYCVMHGGRVPLVLKGFLKKIEKQRARGRKSSAQLEADLAFRHSVKRAQDRIRAKAPKALNRLYDSLSMLLPYAHEKGVKIVLENRDLLEELPLDVEFPRLLGLFEQYAGHIGYWHDTGHAALKAQMGALNIEQHLNDLKPYHFGWHVKDADVLGNENLALGDVKPGQGAINWEAQSEFFQDGQVIVVELGPGAPKEGALKSRERVESLVKARGFEVA